jgi:prefoldin subunit 5
MKVEELEEQYSVANTLVTKLDKKIKRLTQKLEESENTFATVENQHSKVRIIKRMIV